MLAKGFRRDCCVVAVGGGVVSISPALWLVRLAEECRL